MSSSPIARPSIETFTLGSFQTNCSLIIGPAPGRAWIADCGWQPEPMLDRAAQLGLTIEAVVLTHAHCDHISGLPVLRRRLPGVPVLLHEAERAWLEDPRLNLSATLGEFLPGPEGAPVSTAPADRLLSHAERLTLAGAAWAVRHTPGHSPGGIALCWAPSKEDDAGGLDDALLAQRTELVLSGDALFAGSIGRTDFPGSDHAALIRSIREQLLSLPDAAVLHPGHGPTTTVGRERRSNPFLSPFPE